MIHVFGDRIEGGPSRVSRLRDILAPTEFEEMEEFFPGFCGAMVFYFVPIWVECLKVLVHLLPSGIKTGQSIDFFAGIIKEPLGKAEDFLGLADFRL